MEENNSISGLGGITILQIRTLKFYPSVVEHLKLMMLIDAMFEFEAGGN